MTFKKVWGLIAMWAVVLGMIASLVADWGEWDRFAVNMLWRILIVALGGVGGLVLNYFAGNYVGMGTNVIESMGVTKFSDDTANKIQNSFVFVGAVVGALVAALLVK